MEWLARSKDTAKGIPVQTYARHIQGVEAYLQSSLTDELPYVSQKICAFLSNMVRLAARYHDLGKLEDQNQQVLCGEKKMRSLPHIHPDAGAAYLLPEHWAAASLIYAHHTELPDYCKEDLRGDEMFRVREEKEYTDNHLNVFLARHNEVMGDTSDFKDMSEYPAEGGQIAMRMGLSMLADADHTDSSNPDIPLSEIPPGKAPFLLPEKRLDALDRYIAKLPKGEDIRSELRSSVYSCCRNTIPECSIVSCDSPVGTGKTTSVMANLLAVAAKRKLRRIFVVLPFTNIIHQSVEVYRKSLVLPGEKPEDVVAEIHHLIDFEDEKSRDFSTCWHAPIIVTTAVAFFETMASSHPAGVRRLHQLIGSGIFIDEAHAALPVRLLPITWKWMKEFARDWSCYWILASGSLNRFWKISEIDAQKPDIPELIPDEIRKRTISFENKRVEYVKSNSNWTIDDLLYHVSNAKGPRLVILNTVQNAAFAAMAFRNSRQFEKVYHLSTSLTPVDRGIKLQEIRDKMKEAPDGNWVLVGTSCIEAGLDLDFATGFRENASIVSLLQASGRINRSGKRKDSEMYPFHLSGEMFNCNPGLKDAAFVLEEKILDAGKEITPDLCTWAMEQELKLNPGRGKDFRKLLEDESVLDFPEVDAGYRVITSKMYPVLADETLIQKIENYEPVSWKEIQLYSVQVQEDKKRKWNLVEFENFPGLWKWTLKYDHDLGYMVGVLENKVLFDENCGVC